MGLANDISNNGEALPDRVRVTRKHRLDAMPDDLSEVGIVDAGDAEVGDVAVAALAWGWMSRPD